MHVERQDLEGLALLRWEVAEDARGSFSRIFCAEDLAEAGLPFAPVQASLSRNVAAGTLRGLHFQLAPHGEAKIVACLRGRVWDVAVDLRPRSDTFGAWRGFELGTETNAALHIPAGFAHGFLTLEPDSEILYMMDAPFVPAAGAGIRWDDAELAIGWPRRPEILSQRDAELPGLAAIRARLG